MDIRIINNEFNVKFKNVISVSIVKDYLAPANERPRVSVGIRVNIIDNNESISMLSCIVNRNYKISEMNKDNIMITFSNSKMIYYRKDQYDGIINEEACNGITNIKKVYGRELV